jgi:hypothetical protein
MSRAWRFTYGTAKPQAATRRKQHIGSADWLISPKPVSGQEERAIADYALGML